MTGNTAVCEVCLSSQIGPVVDFGFHPLNDDMRKVGTDREIKKYQQKIVLCENCLTAHQVAPVPKEILFFPEYRYRGSLTRDVTNGMEDLVNSVLAFMGEKKLTVLDIGANDGTLLKIFSSKSPDIKTIGIDPTDIVLSENTGIDFPYQSFFNAESATRILNEHGKPDVITFTNVFAHIENLSELIEALDLLLSSNNLVVIENHYLGSVLEKNQFDTFYAEHLRTYSSKSFEFIAKRLNCEIVRLEFPKRYGGNIRVFLSRKKFPSTLNETSNEIDIVGSFTNLQKVYDDWKSDSQVKLEKLASNSILLGKSCPARSVMLFSSLGLDSSVMPFVYEQPTSAKLGFYVPGTSIEVVSDDLFPRGSKLPLILWSWHIAYEVLPYLRKNLDFKGEVWSPLPNFTKI